MNYSAAFELVVLKVLCINEQYAIKVSAMKKCGIIFFAKPATKQSPPSPLICLINFWEETETF